MFSEFPDLHFWVSLGFDLPLPGSGRPHEGPGVPQGGPQERPHGDCPETQDGPNFPVVEPFGLSELSRLHQ